MRNCSRKNKKTNDSGFGKIEALMLLVILAAVGFVGAKVLSLPKANNKLQEITSNVSTPRKVSTISNGKQITFNDLAAKASFVYPNTWTEMSIKGLCDEPNGCSESTDKIDAVELQSPDKKVDLIWSGISGVGGNCDATKTPTQGGCPIETVFSAVPINSSPGLYVVNGAIEAPNGQYEPFLAVQDNNGVLSSGVHGVWYQSFKLASTGNDTVFYMVNDYGSGTVPQTFNTINQVKSYFSGTDQQQAIQILQSLKVGK